MARAGIGQRKAALNSTKTANPFRETSEGAPAPAPQPQSELSEQQSISGNSRKCTISDLHAATCRSAGLDLVTTKELILKEQDQVIIAPIGVWGPLPPGMVGLILGRSSTTTKGIFVQPGVIDSDYQGEIKIMLKASGYHIIPTQVHIAQLLLLPYVISKTQNTVRGEGGFSSIDNQSVFWTESIKLNQSYK